jgi:hypothetical protein
MRIPVWHLAFGYLELAAAATKANEACGGGAREKREKPCRVARCLQSDNVSHIWIKVG